jgi:hypothetical protein
LLNHAGEVGDRVFGYLGEHPRDKGPTALESLPSAGVDKTSNVRMDSEPMADGAVGFERGTAP